MYTFGGEITLIMMMNRIPFTRQSPRYHWLLFKFILAGLCIIILSSCSTTPDDPDEQADWPAKRFYEEAKAALDQESYDKAIKLYEKLEARYPFGTYTAQTQLDIAYAYYKQREPDSAIAAADRFIKLHPDNPHVDYAYYLKGLVNYTRGIGFLEQFLPTDASQRDPGPARDAFAIFLDLIKKFPNSRYVNDAKQRNIALRSNLAMHELHVAKYYMKRGAHVAAAKRAVYIIEKFQRTTAVPLALKVMEQSYTALQMHDLARDTAKIYALNYGPEGATPEWTSVDNRRMAQKIWDYIGFDE